MNIWIVWEQDVNKRYPDTISKDGFEAFLPPKFYLAFQPGLQGDKLGKTIKLS